MFNGAFKREADSATEEILYDIMHLSILSLDVKSHLVVQVYKAHPGSIYG